MTTSMSVSASPHGTRLPESDILDNTLLLGASSSTRGSIISTKLSRALASSYADPDLRKALDVVSSTSPSGVYSYENRRKLQVDAPTSLLKSDGHILSRFKTIADELKDLRTEIECMVDICSTITSEISDADTGLTPIVEESFLIIRRKKGLELRSEILGGFVSKFNISEDELATISSTANDMDEKFFAVVLRLKEIHEGCQVLLANEDTKAGLDVMEQMTKSLHTAFQRLHMWIQSEFRNISFDNPSLSSKVKRALRVLAERPVLFQSCLDILAESRQKILYRNFMDALTNVNEASSGFLPIEMSAHDPLRYVSDMLAWYHSTMVGELEAMTSLFATEVASRSQNPETANVASDFWVSERYFNEKEAIKSLAARDLETINRPLQVRIEQVAITNTQPVTAYRLINLLSFYSETFGSLVGQGCDIISTMNTGCFHNSLAEQAKSRTQDLPDISRDLSPPPFLMDAISDVHDLLSSLQTSFAPAADQGGEVRLILDEALRPYLDSCKSLSSSLEGTDSLIFNINCFSAMLGLLSKHDISASLMDTLSKALDKDVSAAIMLQRDFFAERSGLKRFMKKTDLEEGKDASVGLVEEELSVFASSLDQFLPLASIDARFQLRYITSSKIKFSIIERAAQGFVEDCSDMMAKVFHLLSAERGKELFPMTIQEIQTLVT